MKRGTVNVSLKIDRLVSPEQYSLNLDVLDSYRKQLENSITSASFRVRFTSSSCSPSRRGSRDPGIR